MRNVVEMQKSPLIFVAPADQHSTQKLLAQNTNNNGDIMLANIKNYFFFMQLSHLENEIEQYILRKSYIFEFKI